MRRFVRNAFDLRSRQPNTGPEPSHGLDNPNQLDRMPSTSKALDRVSISPVEAKQEMDATLSSKKDLLQTADYPVADEKPSRSSASTTSGNTTDEVGQRCCSSASRLLQPKGQRKHGLDALCVRFRASPITIGSFLRSPLWSAT